MKTLTAKQLKGFWPGQNCACAARYRGECCCDEADWTPREVYRLRLVVRKLKKKLRGNQ